MSQDTPFAPPTAASAGLAREPRTTRDPAPLARTVVLWLYLFLGADVLVGLAALYNASILQRFDPATPYGFTESLAGAETAEAFLGLAGILLLVSFVVSGFLTLKWIYRTNRNAHALARGMSVSPGWNVGWFFVPIGNLWMPFRGVRETWQVSADPANWRKVGVPGLLRLWWGLWLAYTVLGNISWRLSMQGTVGSTLNGSYVDILASLVNIALTFTLVTVVRSITEAQTVALTRQALE